MATIRIGFESLYPHALLRLVRKKQTNATSCIIIHTGRLHELNRFQHMADGIKRQTEHHAQLKNMKTQEGERLRCFYGIQVEQLPAVLVTNSNGMLMHHWTKENIPSVSDLSFLLRQLSA